MTAVATPVETETPALTFSAGLPGFPDARTFVLIQTELAKEPFSVMRCIEDEGLEFVVVPPHMFFPDYAPEIDDATIERIGLVDSADAIVLVTLSVGDELADVTANLLGPIVINYGNRQAVQAILVNQGYDLRVPLFNKELLESEEAAHAESETPDS